MADTTSMPRQLLRYWTSGEGALRIRWGTPGDFNRCVRALTEETKGNVSERVIKGACANMHRIATGKSPGQH